MRGELADRVAIVSGGGRGIGRAACEALAKAGAAVVLTGRDATTGEAAALAIRDNGGKALFLPQDVTQDAAWADVVARAEKTYGRVDVLVANAGISFGKPAKDMTLAEFRALCDVNLKGVFLGLKHATEAIRRGGRGGSIVLVSSIVGKIGAPGYTHYGAAKDGVRLMAKAAALELGPEQIRVNSLHPGFVRTDMTKGFPEALAQMVPLGRFGEPTELGDAILFLASDRSRFMTGAELVVDGGMSVR